MSALTASVDTDIVKISSVPETLELLRNIDTDIVSRPTPQMFLCLGGKQLRNDSARTLQAVASIMGPYRTGKSFLLDQLVPHDDGMYPFKASPSLVP
jgi:hypothetical protein